MNRTTVAVLLASGLAVLAGSASGGCGGDSTSDATSSPDPTQPGGGSSGEAGVPTTGGGSSGGSGGDAGDSGLRITVPEVISLDENETKSIVIGVDARGQKPEDVRVFVLDRPPGSVWSEAARTLTFRPDFIQGGSTWTVHVAALTSAGHAEASFRIDVRDTIAPPAPRVVKDERVGAWRRLTLAQATDAWLDSTGYAGRSFGAVVTLPANTPPAHSLPVHVVLHGFDGQPAQDGWEGEYRIMPHDPNDTYWWGFARGLPGGVNDAVPGYTARRVLHLLEWVLRTNPGADPERVYVDGVSMGGAGAMTMGLLYARHFAYVDARLGQAIPRNHRPSRVAQLTGLWGAPSAGLPDEHGGSTPVWDFLDLTRVIEGSAEARDQFLFLKHGKDDPTIDFDAVVKPSPLTHRSLYAELGASHVGHLAVWDEGAHGPPDPVLGDGWWQTGWNPIFDDTSFLRQSRAFPAFTASSLDDDPGDGSGNGRRPYDPESGYAGKVEVPGDTGYAGQIAGALGRYLRWDARPIVDTVERFAIPLHVLDGAGGDPPRPGYPATGDKLRGEMPAKVDVTPRRVQAFACRPSEALRWTLQDASTGAEVQSGTITADETGSFTAPRVELVTAWRVLTFQRAL